MGEKKAECYLLSHNRSHSITDCFLKGECKKELDTARSITGTDLPTIEGIYRSRYLKMVASIIRDPHPLTSLLPLGRRHRSLKTVKCGFRSSFFPTARDPLCDASQNGGRPGNPQLRRRGYRGRQVGTQRARGG